MSDAAPKSASAPTPLTPPTSPPTKDTNGTLPKKIALSNSFDTAYTGAVIPPTTDRRSLVLCFDGTGDQFDADNSNVIKFFSMLKKGDKDQQLVYYQAGIGTYTIPQIATPAYSKISKTLDLMFANNLNHHVMSGYEFLMQNYKEGDKICIFGFSRGAYTARALAGMIQKVGLLPTSNHQQVPFAYHMFQKDDEEGWRQSILFKKTFSIDVDIEFVGVWDTVASVGLVPRSLPFTKSNTAIKTFRHAISLDEHRAKFKANYYQWTTHEEAEQNDYKPPAGSETAEVLAAAAAGASNSGTDANHKHDHNHSHVDPRNIFEDVKHASEDMIRRVASGSTAVESIAGDAGKRLSIGENEKARLESMYTDRAKETSVLEVWFAGCHCDVGGGSVENDTRHSLARIPLRWMIRQCFLANTGIQFEADKLQEIAGINPASLYPIVQPRPPMPPLPASPPITWPDTSKRVATTPFSKPASGDGDPEEPFVSEEDEDLKDALCPAYDQLSLAKWWWFLELLPMREHVQRLDGTWTKSVQMNMARPRVLPHQTTRPGGLKVHRTVQLRMQAKELGYTPRLKFEVEPKWAD